MVQSNERDNFGSVENALKNRKDSASNSDTDQSSTPPPRVARGAGSKKGSISRKG